MLKEWIFKLVLNNNLLFNVCWEDPRLDHQALQFGENDNILVICSAGCNALDYALKMPNKVYAVDLNPRQIALLELKISAIKNLDYKDFFEMFGNGRLSNVHTIYKDKLRSSLSSFAQKYWDKKIRFFSTKGTNSFFQHSTTGKFYYLALKKINDFLKITPLIEEIFKIKDLEEQRKYYFSHLRTKMHNAIYCKSGENFISHTMVGVPKAQTDKLLKVEMKGEKQIKTVLDVLFGEIPIFDNYFWRAYMLGNYTKECCPNYLKEENFEYLKKKGVDLIEFHNDTITGFLEKNDVEISHFVLLDHMDWFSKETYSQLEHEWDQIYAHARNTSKIIYRSVSEDSSFFDNCMVKTNHGSKRLGEILKYDHKLAEKLHKIDRVHTYNNFFIATLEKQTGVSL